MLGFRGFSWSHRPAGQICPKCALRGTPLSGCPLTTHGLAEMHGMNLSLNDVVHRLALCRPNPGVQCAHWRLSS